MTEYLKNIPIVPVCTYHRVKGPHTEQRSRTFPFASSRSMYVCT